MYNILFFRILRHNYSIVLFVRCVFIAVAFFLITQFSIVLAHFYRRS
jgi:hypothetical protein